MLALQNKQEERLILVMRELPEEMRQTLLRTAEQLMEEQEDAEDLRIAIEREHEPDIPIEEAFRQIGLRD